MSLRKKLLILGAGVAWAIVASLWAWGWFRARQPEILVVSKAGLEAEDAYNDIATKALGPFPNPNRSRRFSAVNLCFVPPGVSHSDIVVQGIDVRAVFGMDMRIWAEKPYDGYRVEISGNAEPGSPPRVWLRGVEVPLQREPDQRPPLGIVPWENDARSAFFNPSGYAVSKLPGTILSETCARAFKPGKGEHVATVWATGRPVYELDRYSNGVWAGSYVVWPTAVQAKAGSLTKAGSADEQIGLGE